MAQCKRNIKDQGHYFIKDSVTLAVHDAFKHKLSHLLYLLHLLSVQDSLFFLDPSNKFLVDEKRLFLFHEREHTIKVNLFRNKLDDEARSF